MLHLPLPIKSMSFSTVADRSIVSSRFLLQGSPPFWHVNTRLNLDIFWWVSHSIHKPSPVIEVLAPSPSLLEDGWPGTSVESAGGLKEHLVKWSGYWINKLLRIWTVSWFWFKKQDAKLVSGEALFQKCHCRWRSRETQIGDVDLTDATLA